MDPHIQARPTPALALAIALAALAGCSTPEAAKEAKDGLVTPASFVAGRTDAAPGQGRLIVPKRCRIAIAVLSRPSGDAAINEALWGVADEQVIAPDLARTLAGNGLRLGLVRGDLPGPVQGVLRPEPPGKPVDLVEIDNPDGEPAYVDLAATAETLSLFLNRDGRTLGKDYQDAKGLIRVVASRDDSGGIRVKLTPELRHGPSLSGFAAAPTTGPFQPQEFVKKDGQAEESFRDLAATATVRPGEVLVVGGAGDLSRGGLGSFLFTKADRNSDRVEQRVVLIWARSVAGPAEPGATARSRPADLTRANP